MPRRHLLSLGIVLMALVGCAQSSLPPRGQTVDPATNSQQTGNAAVVDSAQSKPVGCSSKERPSDKAVYQLLANVSRFASLDDLTGDAQKTAMQWKKLADRGGAPPEWDFFWSRGGWKDLKLSTVADGGWDVILTYEGEAAPPQYDSTQRFLVLCTDGRWKVARQGIQGRWEDVPVEVPGQRGDLTPELAKTLAFEALAGRGPWLAQVATGAELADGRVEALKWANGFREKYTTPWPGTGSQLALTPEGKDRVVGRWLDTSKKATGEAVRFVRDQGAWMVESHTINGRWLSTEWSWTPEPAPMGLRDSLFGLRLGAPSSGVEAKLGKPDQVENGDGGRTYRYAVRQITVRFDLQDKVIAIEARTGGTDAGVIIGGPSTWVTLVYGPSPDLRYKSKHGEQLRFEIENGQIKAIHLERAQM